MFSYFNIRMNRQTYWTILIPILLLFGLAVAFMPKPPGIAEIILISLGVPRLHDLGRSGWWMAIPIGCEIVAVVLGALYGGVDGILIGGGLVVLLMAIMMIVIGSISGQPQANAYGDAPQPGFSAWRKSTSA